jgi:uncharacterized ParB-like nuclease family protein
MNTVKLETLIRDFNFYPRTQVDSTHVTSMMLSMQAGSELPPIRVDRKTKRIIDGFHRYDAHKRLGRESIDVEWVTCKDDQHFYALAVEANAGHGRPYSPFDRARIRNRAEELGFTIERVSQILKMPIESLAVQKETVFGTDEQGQPVPLKRTIAWKAGQSLTPRQMAANQKLSGMNAAFYANQLSELFESELINWNDDGLIQALARLHGHLRQHSTALKKAA